MSSTSQKPVTEVRQELPTQSEFEWVSLAPSLIAGVLLVIGWLVLEKFARRRERRSDLRETAKFFREAVDEVIKAAERFYLLPGNSKEAAALSRLIRSKIASLSAISTIFRDAGVDVDISTQMKAFRQAVTGGEFDSIVRVSRVHGDPIFEQISHAGLDLSRSLQIQALRSFMSLKTTG